jgi:signal peptidase I
MIIVGTSWQKLIIGSITLVVTIAQPGWGDVSPVPVPLYSEPFCLKIFEEVIDKARSSGWQLSDRDKHILTQCRAKFPPVTNSQTALPTAIECLNIVKTLVQSGVSKVKELELPEERVRSIARCDEVLDYYALPSENMQPTIKSTERIVVDKTAYQTKLPQRGDIIAFKTNDPPQSVSATPTTPTPTTPTPTTPTPSQQPLIQRAIGLPGETVKIDKGNIYINGQLYREEYLTSATRTNQTIRVENSRNQSILVPANHYFVLGDRRENTNGTLVDRAAIVGQVIWHFGNNQASVSGSR